MKKQIKAWLGISDDTVSQYEQVISSLRKELADTHQAFATLLAENKELKKEKLDWQQVTTQKLRIAADQEPVIAKLRAHIIGIRNVGSSLRLEMDGFERMINEFNSSLVTSRKYGWKPKKKKK